MPNNFNQSSDANAAVANEINTARVKLLTLLNVISAKPSNSSKRKQPLDRDWTTIARPAIKSSTSAKPSTAVCQTQPLESSTGKQDEYNVGELACDDGPGHASTFTDMYSYHFGPETVLLNSEQLEATKSPENWKLVSNAKSEGKRVVYYAVEAKATSNPVKTFKLVNSISTALKGVVEQLTSRQAQVLENLEKYEDVWYTDVPYSPSRFDLRKSISIWALQHILKTRSQILKNNKHAPEPSQPATSAKSGSLAPDFCQNLTSETETRGNTSDLDIRDQGFTRPKVLVLLPFRSSAYDWISSILSVTPGSKSTVKGLDRFEQEYTLPKGMTDKLEGEDAELKFTLEHRMTFRGNVDDDFKLGIKLNRKEVKLYSDFYQSDFIVGSPVGLRKLIEKEGDADFLSSIEVTIVDQMDVMLMQNWEHVDFIFDHLNQIPTKPRDTDFSRVKPWYLDHRASYLRQTILLSSLTSPEQNSLFRRLSNVAGKSIHFNQLPSVKSGVLWKIRKGLQQTWLKFGFDENEQQEEDFRFRAFKDKILSTLEQSALVKAGLGGIMIFVPNYFDFVRLEDHMRSLGDVRYVAISEYSSPAEITAARSAFFNKHVSYLLVTERFHFYHRYKLRGATNIIFYAPPIHPDYYVEFCNEYPFDKGEVEVEEVKVQVLFSDLDQSRIERIVGIQDCRKMVKGNGTKFTFV
ncbi:hypothetical protein CROQUDRAFT_101571 [Cronartium quercuum f. sp. fusiforme G11]|uniref:U3 small nucleolar RNA-associated protein 25 n=1 Tax=Cronartium quercuum f. sp. fusiforme G11 TaxID=708437 RepID=A0A9P6N5A2_9BASI|nr:hypothetical protein CROQUDRAFT_101571 [Cronartium quercuum f. sp. fusiforme G11]